MKQIRRFGVFVVVLVLMFALLAATALADTGLGITNPCYVLVSPTNNSAQMVVTWWDSSDVTTASVQYSTTSSFANTAGASMTTVAATVSKTDTTNDYTAFEATMNDLAANTTYYYRVGHDEVWSDEYSFITADPSTSETSFMYMGDIQYASYATAAADYQAWGSLLQGAYQKFPGLDFGILGGDMVQNGMKADNWQMFLAQATTTFCKLPMLAVPGNHESNSATTGKPELFLNFLAMPTNGPTGFKEEFYSYDYGNCHVVALSSNVFSNEQLLNGSMTEDDFDRIATWIQDDLANSNATWKIVVMHHPAYAVVSDDVATEVLANWAPIFVDAQVDMVFCGHQHIYMRTKAIKGVTYVMGNSGSKFYASAGVPYSAKMIANTSTYQIVNADDTNLVMTTYDVAGNSLDTVMLSAKDRTVTPVWTDPITGDINGDGYITDADVQLVINAILDCLSYSSNMDLNSDGKVDICDAHKLALLCAE